MRVSVVLLGSVLFIACGEAPPTSPAPKEAAPPIEAPPTPEAPISRAGVVLETISTEKYTFARLDNCGSEAWVAGPVVQYQVGQTVEMTGGMGMEAFHSKALDRTFDQILFVDKWAAGATPLVCPQTQAPPTDPDAPPQEAQDYRIGVVKEVIDAAGYTYARMEVCSEDVWVAAPTTSVKVGSIGATPWGTEMKDFKSTALERTFPSVWFVQWIKKSPKLPPC